MSKRKPNRPSPPLMAATSSLAISVPRFYPPKIVSDLRTSGENPSIAMALIHECSLISLQAAYLEQVLLRDPTQENVAPVVEDLRRRLPLSVGKMIQTPLKNMAASKAAEEHGMGPRGSALIFRYTNYHRLLEVSLADLKKKEDCILCPTGYAASMTFITALGSIISLLSPVEKATGGDKIAIFSDELNHASIIDGICLVERQREV